MRHQAWEDDRGQEDRYRGRHFPAGAPAEKRKTREPRRRKTSLISSSVAPGFAQTPEGPPS